jgi:hypothetical protein
MDLLNNAAFGWAYATFNYPFHLFDPWSGASKMLKYVPSSSRFPSALTFPNDPSVHMDVSMGMPPALPAGGVRRMRDFE